MCDVVLKNYLKISEFCITAINFKSVPVRPGCMNYIHLIEERTHTLGLSWIFAYYMKRLTSKKRSKKPLKA